MRTRNYQNQAYVLASLVNLGLCPHPMIKRELQRNHIPALVTVCTNSVNANVKQIALDLRKHWTAVGTWSNPQCMNTKCTVRAPDSKMCSRCKDVLYCSKKCQTVCWKEHKQVCKPQVAKEGKDAKEEKEAKSNS